MGETGLPIQCSQHDPHPGAGAVGEVGSLRPKGSLLTSLFVPPPGLEREPGPMGSGQGGPVRCPSPEPRVSTSSPPASGLECAAAAGRLGVLRQRGGPVVRRAALVQPRGRRVCPQRHLHPLHSGEAVAPAPAPGVSSEGPPVAALTHFLVFLFSALSMNDFKRKSSNGLPFTHELHLDNV